jgi:hypothetical protein
VVASPPFAPEIVLPTIRYFVERVKLQQTDTYGFKATFNPTYPSDAGNRRSVLLKTDRIDLA